MELIVLSLRYSSWSMRAWLALTTAGANFRTTTVDLPEMKAQTFTGGSLKIGISREDVENRRKIGSVKGFFPVLHVPNPGRSGKVERIHETLAICEYVADVFPDAGLWPNDPLSRGLARGITTEMATGFPNLRGELSCHLHGRINYAEKMKPETKEESERVFEIWRNALERAKEVGEDKLGPFLFGRWSIADCFYFPVITRFHTYGVTIPDDLKNYEDAVMNFGAVKELLKIAQDAPAISLYNEILRKKAEA